MKNELLAARASDLRDVGGRVLRLITGTESDPIEFPPDTILIAEDLTPSDTASLDRTPRARLLHHHRRRVLARRDPGALAGAARDRRDRGASARDPGGHQRDPRRHEGHAAAAARAKTSCARFASGS